MACLLLVVFYFFLLVRDINRSQSFVRKSKLFFIFILKWEMSSILGKTLENSFYLHVPQDVWLCRKKIYSLFSRLAYIIELLKRMGNLTKFEIWRGSPTKITQLFAVKIKLKTCCWCLFYYLPDAPQCRQCWWKNSTVEKSFELQTLSNFFFH